MSAGVKFAELLLSPGHRGTVAIYFLGQFEPLQIPRIAKVTTFKSTEVLFRL